MPTGTERWPTPGPPLSLRAYSSGASTQSPSKILLQRGPCLRPPAAGATAGAGAACPRPLRLRTPPPRCRQPPPSAIIPPHRVRTAGMPRPAPLPSGRGLAHVRANQTPRRPPALGRPLSAAAGRRAVIHVTSRDERAGRGMATVLSLLPALGASGTRPPGR